MSNIDNVDFIRGSIYLSKQQKCFKKFCNFFLGLCIVICFLLALFPAFFFTAVVDGKSMQPLLNKNIDINPEYEDSILAVNVFSLKNNDLVVVDLPNKTEDGIKRLIAKGGDTLSFGNIFDFSEDKIYLNGEVLNEEYVACSNQSTVNDFKLMIRRHLDASDNFKIKGCKVNEQNGTYSITLEEDYCIYLGDNRVNSFDCSDFGPVKINTVLAKVVMIIPPKYTFISYLMHIIFG